MMELEQLTWSKPLEGITAFQVTRGKVNPRNPYSEYNLCDYTGDDALRVLNARIELCAALGIDMDRLVMPRQVHGTHIAIIDNDYFNADFDQQEKMLDGADAIITAMPGVCIGINTADCVNIILADPSTGIIAAAHAGWKGAAARIAGKTVKAMTKMGAEPAHILVTMGASICQDCFEVGDEVVDAFHKEKHDISLIMKRNATTGKAHIDLRRACALDIETAGVPTSNICQMGTCTRCQPQRYFSARRLGINSGRTFTAIIRQ
ncbi:MAG: peptidoglycan editing factor PgeF [Muribaculaceae bacterium]|nr:peptidoglycan editing factor PgeF [Muribaculaceae bacterium]